MLVVSLKQLKQHSQTEINNQLFNGVINMAMFPSTATRVAQHTAPHINDRIQFATQERVARIAQHGPAAIERRLAELDREWDIERVLEANAASFTLLGSALGVGVDRRFFALPALVAGFLLQHAIQGWCPPLPLFRRLGVRTMAEIEDERNRLNNLRVDLLARAGRSAMGNTHDARDGFSQAQFDIAE